MSIRLWQTLLPSPMKENFNPSRRPLCSQTVSRSARAWQGCSRSERPLMTGMEAYSARVTTVLWAKVRAMMRSAQRERLRATSGTVSRTPSWMSAGPR